MIIMKISKHKYAQLQLLKNKKYRYKEGLFILESEKLIRDAVKFGAEVLYVAHSEKFSENEQNQEFLNFLKNRGIEIYEIEEKHLRKISDLETSQGIIAVAKMFEYNENDVLKNIQRKEYATIVALDRISEPGNLGAIFRVCDWFRVDLILISGMSVDVFNPKTVRATMGSIFNVPFLRDVDLRDYIFKLKNFGFKIFSTAPSGEVDFRKIRDDKKIAFIFGSESHGVSNELCKISDAMVKIRRFGKAESLNVAVSVGIILSERAYLIFEQR